MKPDKAFWWLLFMMFAFGYNFGEGHNTDAWRGLGDLFNIVIAFFVISTLIRPIIDSHTRRQEDRWKAPQSQPRTKPSSKGMVRTVAAVARATGTHVTVREDPKPSASSAEGRQKQEMPILPRDKLRSVSHDQPGQDSSTRPGYEERIKE